MGNSRLYVQRLKVTAKAQRSLNESKIVLGALGFDPSPVSTTPTKGRSGLQHPLGLTGTTVCAFWARMIPCRSFINWASSFVRVTWVRRWPCSGSTSVLMLVNCRPPHRPIRLAMLSCPSRSGRSSTALRLAHHNRIGR